MWCRLWSYLSKYGGKQFTKLHNETEGCSVWPSLKKKVSPGSFVRCDGSRWTAIPLMWNRDGASDTSNVLNSAEQWPPSKRLQNRVPSHTPTTMGKAKNGLCLNGPAVRSFCSTWDKVEKHVGLCLYFLASFALCFMHFTWEPCVCAEFTCSPVMCRTAAPSAFYSVFMCGFEMCIVCFLHFPFPSLLLFSVMSPTVSLPTRPASLDLSHEEATFWLQWCVLKNPCLNSVDPPTTWDSRIVVWVPLLRTKNIIESIKIMC